MHVKKRIYIYIHMYIYICVCVYVYILCLLVEHGRDDYICNRGVYGKICFWVIVFFIYLDMSTAVGFDLGLGSGASFFFGRTRK